MVKKVKKIAGARANKLLADKFLGGEPIFEPGAILDDTILYKVFNWYSYNITYEHGLKWLIEWAKKTSHPALKEIRQLKHNNISPTICWIARLKLNGYEVPQRTNEFLERRIRECIAAQVALEEDRPAPIKPNISPMERVKRRSDDLIAELEEVVDSFMGEQFEFDMYSWLVAHSASNIHSKRIADYYRPMMEEYESILKKNTEGYEKLSKKAKLGFFQFYSTIVNDSIRYAENFNIKKVRKTRTVKLKSPEQKSSKARFKKENTELKIVSILPSKIIGSSQVWVYNDKYRKMQFYVASPGKVLDIEGTKIVDFDPTLSIQKGVRKPDWALSHFKSMNKTGLRKYMESLKTTQSTVNGRLTEDSIILRAD